MSEHLLSGSDEAELIRCIQQRQQKALGLLYDKYAAELLGLIERIVGDPNLAGVVLQQVFIKIWHQISEFDVRKTSFFIWMFNMARHTALEVVQSAPPKELSNIRNKENHVYNTTDFPGNRITTGQDTSLPSLEDREKIVLELIYYKNASFKEAAEQLGIDEETVKTIFQLAINTQK